MLSGLVERLVMLKRSRDMKTTVTPSNKFNWLHHLSLEVLELLKKNEPLTYEDYMAISSDINYFARKKVRDTEIKI